MIRKPSGLALSGMTLLCAVIFAACNCAPTLRYLTVGPTSGTIYVSAPLGVAAGGARRAARPAIRSTRKAAVTPQDITTAVCGSLQYSATGYYSNGTTQDQSGKVTWSSSSSSVASVDNTGLASGVALGFTNIGATLGGITAPVQQLEVDQLNSITVAPANQSIAKGLTQVFTASGNFTLAAGGSASQDISGQVTWGTGDATVATIDQTGTATAVNPGTTTVSATSCDGVIVGSTTLTVTGAAPQTLQIVPGAPTASAGTTVLFTAVQLLSDGSTQPLPSGTVLTWASDTTGVASVFSSTGLAQALTAGTANISATVVSPPSVAGLTGSTALTVQAATARFAYVANIQGGSSFGGTITSYTVNASSTTTPLTHLADTAAATPQQVLLHPSGDLLYYIDSGGNLHSDYVSATDGSLTATPLAPTPASDIGSDIYTGVIDPTGRFLYVVTNGSSVLYGFTITHTQPARGTNDGALTPISGLVAFTDGGNINFPSWVLTDKTGQYLYVINQGDGVNPSTVCQYSIDQTTGALTSLGAPVATGVFPEFATVDVNGHLFVANQGATSGSGSISAYNITASGSTAGQLTLIGTTNVPTANDSINVITDPTGKYLYVLDLGSPSAPTSPGQVLAYNLAPATGVIGSQIGTTQPTDLGPTGMAIDPTGVLLAVDNSEGADISTYTIGSSGGVTPTTPATTPASTKAEFVVFYTAASDQ